MLLIFGCGDGPYNYIPSDAVSPKLPSANLRVLILGNSIAKHPPDSAKGWYGDWGMAASAADSDFVHILSRRIASHLGYQPMVEYHSIASFEMSFISYNDFGKSEFAGYKNFAPHLVVLRIGDNVSPSMAIKYEFQTYYAQLIRYFSSDSTLVISTSSWFPNNTVNGCIRIACEETKTWYLDISDLYSDASNRARFERHYANDGVGKHPGNKGMREIAEVLWETCKTLF
jgi:hypothetical protein